MTIHLKTCILHGAAFNRSVFFTLSCFNTLKTISLSRALALSIFSEPQTASLSVSVSAELALAVDVISARLVTGNMEAISGSVFRVPCERLGGGGSGFIWSLPQQSACCLLLCYVHSLLKHSLQGYCPEPILFFLFYFKMVSFILHSSLYISIYIYTVLYHIGSPGHPCDWSAAVVVFDGLVLSSVDGDSEQHRLWWALASCTLSSPSSITAPLPSLHFLLLLLLLVLLLLTQMSGGCWGWIYAVLVARPDYKLLLHVEYCDGNK